MHATQQPSMQRWQSGRQAPTRGICSLAAHLRQLWVGEGGGGGGRRGQLAHISTSQRWRMRRCGMQRVQSIELSFQLRAPHR
jgi:hypothetical protein